MRQAPSFASRLAWLIASAFIFSLALAHHVQMSAPRPTDPYLVATDTQESTPSRGIPGWLRRRGGMFESATEVGKNHHRVHAAFEDVVERANASTVRIMSGNRQVSLGVVVRENGYILTKATELPGEVICRVPGNIIRTAKTVAVDNDYDLALLKIDVTGLQPAPFAKSLPPVGSWVATPGGFTADPVAVGVISVPERRIRPEYGVLGIQLEDTTDGPRVTVVMPNSGAEAADLETGDLVEQINGQAIADFASLRQAVRHHRPGDKLQVQVLRGTQRLEKEVTLTQQSEVLPDDEAIQNSIGGRLSRRRAGFSMALQHDTVLSPHQCGGPLVDLDGNVIGINIARAGRVATYALPADTVQQRVRDLLEQAEK